MNRRLIHPLGVGFFALILAGLYAGCSPSKPAPAASTVIQPLVGGLDENNFRRLWMDIVPLDKEDTVNRVFVQQDLVLACTPNNVVYTLSNSDGVLRYFRYVNGGGRQVRPPVVLANAVVFPGQSNLEVYNRVSGDLQKSIPLDFTISSDGVGSGDDIFIGADKDGGQLAKIDVSEPYVPVRWTLLSFGEVTGAPAVFDSVIFFGSGDGNLRAIDDQRRPYWILDHDSYDTTGPIKGDIKADAAGVYATNLSGRLVCLDRSSGHLKWQYLAPHPLETGPLVTQSTVYQEVPELGLVALDKQKLMAVETGGSAKVEEVNRTQRWNCPEAAQFVAEDRQFTYVRTTSNELWALDRLTGQVRYRGTGTHFSSMATNVTDSTIYVTTADGVVYAIKSVLQPGSPGYLE